MALELLRQRQKCAAEETLRRGFEAKSRSFVFPARSKFSRSGHYSDATDLLDDLREEVGLEKLNRHDLRRSFGAAMTSLGIDEVIKSRFLNHAHAEVTDTYTQAEWQLLRESMMRIEQSILTKAPNVYNALKPVDWPPLPAPAPHVCRPPKPRSGRPSAKATKQAAES
jgi:integrase